MNQEYFQNKLDELLRSIEKRPEIYIGEKSLQRLYFYIQGFLHAFHTMDDAQGEAVFYPGFQKWIQEKYHIDSSQNWSRIICFYSTSEADAFDNFYKLLKEFISNVTNINCQF